MSQSVANNDAARYSFFAQTLNAWNLAKRPKSSSKLRVLVIDDHEPTAESLAAALGCEGYETRYECSSIEGIASTNTWLPDVVVLDANMPERDGFATASVIRRIVPCPDLVIIAFTGEKHEDIELQAFQAGFDAYCQKSLPLANLLDNIRSLTASRA
jgi:CheY-like chemotaxis protein